LARRPPHEAFDDHFILRFCFRRELNLFQTQLPMITLDTQTKFSAGTCSGVEMGLCGSETAARVERCIAYMAQHLDRPLQVATLAAQARVSPSHFFALFKRRIGSAPMDYFTRLRMQRACRLLEETGFSIKEISSKLGYDDQFYFSRVFKSINGVAPSDYRLSRNSK
jgi:AraC-like DNA-binding protein